jgi:hypothetical protein
LTVILNADFVVFNNCSVHECLRVRDGALFEIVDLVPNPLRPDFWLADMLIGSEDVLNFLSLGENMGTCSHKSEQVGQFGIDGRDIEVDNG